VACKLSESTNRQESISASLTPLAGARARLEVTVAAGEIEERLRAHIERLAKTMKIPGFRRGKIPPELVIRRLGRDSLIGEVVRDQVGRWYVGALGQCEITPIGDPQVTLGEMPAPGASFQFSCEVAVLPEVKLGSYKGVEAPQREPRVDEQLLKSELEALRERFARLDDVERAAQLGDHVVIDYQASIAGKRLSDGEGRDELYELGRRQLPEAIERALIGTQAGETHEVQIDYPPDHPDRRLAGKSAHFTVTLKAVKHKQLPEIDEDLAADAGFDSLAELRGEIEAAVLAGDADRAQAEFRQAALDAVVAGAQLSIPEGHTRARAQEIWERTARRLGARGIPPEEYLRASGRSEQELLAELLPVAEQSIKREAVLAAVIAAEGIAPGDEEVLAAYLPEGEQEGVEEIQAEVGGAPGAPDQEAGRERRPRTREEREQLLERLRAAGQLEELREQLAAERAIELIAQAAKPIAPERAAAREKLWTPEEARKGQAGEVAVGAGEGADRGSQSGGLWTPSTSR
jgi:trigger factor